MKENGKRPSEDPSGTKRGSLTSRNIGLVIEVHLAASELAELAENKEEEQAEIYVQSPKSKLLFPSPTGHDEDGYPR